MRVRCWGTRGSIATPGPGTVRYGGNTSCLELRADDGQLVLLDCGTGARGLGRELVEAFEASGAPLRGAVLLGHTHWDHIQGLPFFAPLFHPEGRWDLYGPRGLGTSLRQTLAGQMQYQYFPVSVEQLGAQVAYHDLVEGTFELGALTVRTQYLNHPALTLGYRVEGDAATFCYLADHEPFDPSLGDGGDVLASPPDRRHVTFMSGADLVVHDAQYDASEYPAKVGWGHSTIEYVIDAACAAGVGTVVLFHHDPGRDDEGVDALLDRARARAAGRVDVLAATEGEWLDVRPGSSRAATRVATSASASTSPAIDDLATTIVVAVKDPSLRAQILAAASAEDLVVVDAERVGSIAGDGRALVVVDLDDDPVEALRALQGEAGGPSLSQLGVLAVTRTMRTLAAAPSAVTDCIVWPATAAHVRTKLRSAVLRRACRWLAAPLPPDEEHRVESLHRLGVLDTPPEERFDRLTDAARTACDVPIALITLVDADRQWFKSHAGVDAAETPRDESVCAHAILEPDVLQVTDLLDDPRFADNPNIADGLHARFYAGAPLVLDDGSAVGTLCVVDHRPRVLDEGQLQELRRLARQVVDELQR